MRAPGWVLGFHGCDLEVAERVLGGTDEVRTSANAYDWLGSGAYFWENNPGRALAWAEFLASANYHGPRNIRRPAVIGAIIDPGHCLDLTESSSLALVSAAHDGLTQAYVKVGVAVPANEPGHSNDQDFVKRHLDCAVLNFLHEMRQNAGLEAIDTVRAPFMEGGPLYPGAKIASGTHVQWCVREPRRSIISYFRPRDPDAEKV